MWSSIFQRSNLLWLYFTKHEEISKRRKLSFSSLLSCFCRLHNIGRPEALRIQDGRQKTWFGFNSCQTRPEGNSIVSYVRNRFFWRHLITNNILYFFSGAWQVSWDVVSYEAFSTQSFWGLAVEGTGDSFHTFK